MMIKSKCDYCLFFERPLSLATTSEKCLTSRACFAAVSLPAASSARFPVPPPPPPAALPSPDLASLNSAVT